jgi:hypothetical protein
MFDGVEETCHEEVSSMSWMTYYVEVSMRQREAEIARRIARERQVRKQLRAARGPRPHWWSLRRSAPATRAPAARSREASSARTPSWSTSRP